MSLLEILLKIIAEIIEDALHEHARGLIAAWRKDYNHHRPHTQIWFQW
ncbi:transposase [Leisingera caerulea]|uniref:Transposase n=1 Tax=Leisingera caerulea TaxID=506591 RepID=A0ABY5WYP0_LEICA|nr:transposase [Leisingera caerulea]